MAIWDELWITWISLVIAVHDDIDASIKEGGKDFDLHFIVFSHYIEKLMFRVNANPHKIIIQLHVGLEIALFSKNILSVWL